MKVRIGVDLMGGDHSPLVIWEVLVDVLNSCKVSPTFTFIAFASSEVREEILKDGTLSDGYPEIIVSESVIAMEDSPLTAIRKKSSSMALGLDCLSEGQLDAFISSGNTGALITLSRAKIPAFPKVTRPALLVHVPTMRGKAAILDVGANIHVKPEEMIDFARMGIAYRQCLGKIEQPKLGLLNIGSEERKGTESHRQTFRMLREVFQDAFVGNIESGDIFNGVVDVVVTDGFTGNVFLKTAEGVFDFLRHLSGNKIETMIKDQLGDIIYPGSMVCGLSKLVIKCHGKASTSSLFHCILGSIDLAQARVCSQILSSLV